MSLVETTKQCLRCQDVKSLAAFNPRYDEGAPEGATRNVCRACQNEANRKGRRRRAVESGEARTCKHCGETKPITAFPIRYDSAVKSKPGVRRSVCRACINKRQNELRQGDVRVREVKRKLPSYEKLKKLVLEDGLTYGEIAKKYRMSSGQAVHHTLRRRAQMRGEWPLIPPEMARRRTMRRIREHWHVGGGNLLDATYLRGLLNERLPETENRVFVASRRVVHAPNSLEAFAVVYGFDRGHLRAIADGKQKTIKPATAVRLYELLGEEVPDWMRPAPRRRAAA